MNEKNIKINDLTNIKTDIILNHYIDTLNLNKIKGGDVKCESRKAAVLLCNNSCDSSL